MPICLYYIYLYVEQISYMHIFPHIKTYIWMFLLPKILSKYLTQGLISCDVGFVFLSKHAEQRQCISLESTPQFHIQNGLWRMYAYVISSTIYNHEPTYVSRRYFTNCMRGVARWCLSSPFSTSFTKRLASRRFPNDKYLICQFSLDRQILSSIHES